MWLQLTVALYAVLSQAVGQPLDESFSPAISGGIAHVGSPAPAPGDPSAGNWGLSATLLTARQDFKAVVLQNGSLQNSVLAIGGCCDAQGSLAKCEIFSAITGTWQQTGSLQAPRWLFQAVAMVNGSALAVGGLGVASGGVLKSTELFQPSAHPPYGSWRRAADMQQARQDFALVLLSDGKVLATGGFMASTEIYDPLKDEWTMVSPMTEARSSFQAVLLRDGRVLAIGGRGRRSGALNTCEIFDPVKRAWTSTGNMTQGRAQFAALTLQSGKVLVAGGRDDSGRNLNSSEIFEPATGVWVKAADMSFQRSDLQAVELPSGQVLVGGGLGGKSDDEVSILSASEYYDPSANKWFPTEPMVDARYGSQLVSLANTTVMVLGGTGLKGFTASTEIYQASTM